jgi:inhibitor of cysteine peptidase
MSEIVVTQKDLGSIIETYRGDVIELRLGENLTTGYRWEVKTEGSVVELIGSTYVEAPGKALGRGGTRVLRFVAKSPGSQEIRLRLRRPWDPPDGALEHLDMKIRVQ